MMLPRWFPTATWLRLAIVPALVFIATAIDHQYLVDFWHHLARGRAMFTDGQLLNHDIHTFTVAGTEFRDANWLTQIGYYALFELGGLDLVQFVNAATLALTFFLLVLFCWRRSSALPLAAAVGIFVFFGSREVLTLRPQTFSLLLFVLIYLTLDAAQRRPWLLLIPPLLIGLWANVHGAFPAGIMLVGCYFLAAAWQAWRRGQLWRDQHSWTLAGCLAASLLATLANPYGLGIYEYIGVTSNRAAERGIIEWLPPTFDLMSTWAGALSLLALVGLYLANWRRFRRTPSAQEVFLILCFLPLACRSVRMIVWWLIVIAPLVTTLAAALVQPREKKTAFTFRDQPQPTTALVFVLILLAVLLSVPGLQTFNPLLNLPGREQARTETDLDTVCQYLHTHNKSARIFTRFEWGEYLDWAATHGTVFMDGRIEIYPDAVWNEYVVVSRGADNWQHVLDHYHVDVLVLDVAYHTATGLLPKVESSGQWQRVFHVRDEIYVFFRQTGQESSGLTLP